MRKVLLNFEETLVIFFFRELMCVRNCERKATEAILDFADKTNNNRKWQRWELM
jgi:hypothetical protein